MPGWNLCWARKPSLLWPLACVPGWMVTVIRISPPAFCWALPVSLSLITGMVHAASPSIHGNLEPKYLRENSFHSKDLSS